jgi:DNA polymerase-3 subunit delta
MTAVRSGEAERFIARPPADVCFVLVFGPDAGLVAERVRAVVARAVADPKDPFQLLRLSGDDLAADPLRLADEANTIPMFGGRRAIWIEARGKGFLPAFDPLLAAPPVDCTIVVEAGALKRDAPLRRFFEQEKRAAAIECMPDSAKDVAVLVERELAAASLSIAPAARTYLMSLLGQDRLATRGEIEKLVTYAHGAGEVTLEDVETIVADASMLALDRAIDGAFEGNYAAVEHTAERAFAEGGDANMLLAMALRHATTLHRARLDMEAGQVSAGFGYRRGKTMETHLRQWTAARLHRAMAGLAEAVQRVRREPRLAEATAVRALWSVALAARGRDG